MSSKAASSAAAIACASTCSSSTPKPAIISGPSGSISRWPISSICRTKSSRALANALNTELVVAEARRAEQAPNPDSMDLYFQGLAWLNKGLPPRNLDASAQFFRSRALPPIPTMSTPRRISARGSDRGHIFTMSPTPWRLSRRPKRKLAKALSLVPDHARGHVCVGICRDTDQARRTRASPNVSMRWSWIEILPAPIPIGLVRFLSAAPKKPRLTFCDALRLSPRDTMAYSWMFFAGLAKSPRQLRGSDRVVSAGNRGQPKLSA